ncbi:MAG: DNA primase regulatory subunit PriL, partial [Methanothrix soehngenii]
MKISDYPFTQEAAEAVRCRNISLDSLLDKSLFQSVRSRAAERLRGAVGGEAIPEGRASSESEQLFELLSYPLARVMVSCL